MIYLDIMACLNHAHINHAHIHIHKSRTNHYIKLNNVYAYP